MKVGDLVFIVSANDTSKHGIGLYLGNGNRGDRIDHPPYVYSYYAFLWKGRVATFDRPYWKFEVISHGK